MGKFKLSKELEMDVMSNLQKWIRKQIVINTTLRAPEHDGEQ